MSELTLRWLEAGQVRRHVLREQQASKVPGALRLGRDPARCDLLLSDPTVSGLHVEIFFQPAQQRFCLRNLRESNPPTIDGQILRQGETPLRLGSRIQLGRVELMVEAISLTHLPAVAPPIASPTYGLKCPNPDCGKVVPYDQTHLQRGCPWCGVSLAAAQSVMVTTQGRSA